MSFYSKARGMAAAVAGALVQAFGYGPARDLGVHRYSDLPNPVFKMGKRGRAPRRKDKRGRGLRAANGARLTVRYPANGCRP